MYFMHFLYQKTKVKDSKAVKGTVTHNGESAEQ